MQRFQKRVRRWEKNRPIITAVLIGVSIVLFWRGVWMLADEFLFPKDRVLSAIVGLLIALLILYIRDFSLKEIFH